jgi:RNA polymerase sigma-70 factor (ECF subfamily)
MAENRGMENNDRDIALMELVKKGDDAAFDELVTRHYQSVYRLAYRFLYDSPEAEDITQEVFLRVYRAAKTYTPKAKFSTWLYTITKNLCFNELRKKKSVTVFSIEDEMLPELPSPDDSPVSKLEEAEVKQRVLDAVKALPANLRIAVLLLKYHDLSYEEVADILGCTVNAVKLRVHRAKKFLAKSIGYISQETK